MDKLKNNLKEMFNLVTVRFIKSTVGWLYFVGSDELDETVKIRVHRNDHNEVEIKQVDSDNWEMTSNDE